MGNPREAVEMAVLLKNIVVNQKLFVPIKGRNYATVDAWQLAGFLTGMSVIVDEPKNLSTDKEVKYAVTAKLYKGEILVGIGYALCSSKESLKKSFDEYAILSFAQTRAIGKAYRNKIGFIMKLAGFQATPSEEMHRVNETVNEPSIEYGAPTAAQNQGVQTPKKGQVIGPDGTYVWLCSKCDSIVDEVVANYSQKLYGKILCRADQKGAKKK